MSAPTSFIRPAKATLARIRLPLTFVRTPIHRAASTSAPTPSSSASPSTPGPSKPKGPKRPISSCPAGTVMTGLSVMKDQPDPVALPDDQYPDWLWTLLPDTTTKSASKETDKPRSAGELKSNEDFRQEKKRLRAVNRADIKGANYLKTT